MGDRFGRDKWAFWAFVFALAALLAVPSAVLLRCVHSYYDFLTGAAPGTIRPTQVDFLDRGRGAAPLADANLHFVEFSLRAPRAKSVEMIGDFNAWKAGTLPLTRGRGGVWEIMLPLPSGHYHYLFLKDGQAQTDPRAASDTGTGAGAGDKKTSLRIVP